MTKMKAWVRRGDGVVLDEVDTPRQMSDDVLVRVAAFSLNRGELRAVSRGSEGTIPGWDVAGVVAEPAPGGKGPKAGTRVAALVNNGAWAEYVSVPVSRAAVIPDSVDFENAATLPIAGLTVIRALDVAGSLLGKRALITGGSGGVGQLAIQLASMSGAAVTAVSSHDDATEVLRRFGAETIVRQIGDATGAFDFILESVGGSSLSTAIDLVARGGVVVTIGQSSEEKASFDARTLFAKGGASIYGLLVFEELDSHRIESRDLERLLSLVAAEKLRPWIEVRRPWNDLESVLADLKARKFSGKAVLTVD